MSSASIRRILEEAALAVSRHVDVQASGRLRTASVGTPSFAAPDGWHQDHSATQDRSGAQRQQVDGGDRRLGPILNLNRGAHGANAAVQAFDRLFRTWLGLSSRRKRNFYYELHGGTAFDTEDKEIFWAGLQCGFA